MQALLETRTNARLMLAKSFLIFLIATFTLSCFYPYSDQVTSLLPLSPQAAYAYPDPDGGDTYEPDYNDGYEDGRDQGARDQANQDQGWFGAFFNQLINFIPNAIKDGLGQFKDEIMKMIKEFVNTMLIGFINQLIDLINQVFGVLDISNISAETLSGLPYGSELASFATGVAASLKAAGYAVLGIVFLVRMNQYGARLEGHGMTFMIKDVIMMCVVFCIFKAIIDNTDAILGSLLHFAHFISIKMQAASGGSLSVSVAQITDTPADADTGKLVAQGLGMILALIISVVAIVIAQVVIALRTLQIAFYWAVSPVPISLMFLDQTRQMGVNFLKNFFAICLSAGVIVFATSVAKIFVTQASSGGMLNAFLYPIMGAVALAVVCLKSGAWARQALGD